MIRLERGHFGWEYYIVRDETPASTEYDDTNSVYVQSDWDYPGTASTFGWAPCHDGTDGTVDCECGRTASELISEAHDYLAEHLGDIAPDPGYFV